MSADARMRITAGRPTDEELAVVVAVVAGAGRQATSAAQRRRPPPAAPAWGRAARSEALGGPPVAAPSDLHRLD